MKEKYIEITCALILYLILWFHYVQEPNWFDSTTAFTSNLTLDLEFRKYDALIKLEKGDKISSTSYIKTPLLLLHQ